MAASLLEKGERFVDKKGAKPCISSDEANSIASRMTPGRGMT
jgi:hypothetical protein